MCEIKNENFNQIAAALAHEVKNPVALIKANIELIEDEFGENGFDNNIQIIKRQLNKITYIVSDFIQLVRPSTKSEEEEVFICDLINDIIEDYDISLKGKNIKFETQTENEDISIWGNYTKLSILFFNIFKNAVEAIGDTGIIISKIKELEDYILISIKDNGCGINPEIKDKIYQPFITTKKDGSGLGLAICKSIIDEYNGTFEVINRDCGGCVVNIKLSK